jgi:hypothetical protein
MAENALVFTTRGSAEVLHDIEQQRMALERKKQAVKDVTAEFRAEEREQKKLAALAEQIARQNESAQDRYVRKVNEARAALKGHKDETALLAKEEARLRQELEATEEQFDSTFDVTKLAGVAAGFLSAQQAAKLITDELRAQQELIDKRTATQLTVGGSRNVLLRNLIGNEPLIGSTLAEAKQIANLTGVSEIAINQGLAQTISATGANVPLSIDLTRTAAQFLKDQPAAIGTFAGTLADLTRVTGSQDPMVQLGLLAKVGQLSRVADPKAQAENIAPALIGTMAFGGDATSSGALFAALTGGSADKMGATTGTALIGLAQQLEAFALGKDAWKDLGGNMTLAPQSFGGRIGLLQQNPEWARKFLDHSSFEKKLEGPIRQLLTDPTSQVARDYQSNLKAFPDQAGLRAAGQGALDVFRFNKLENVAEFDRRLSSTLETLQTQRPSDRLTTEQLETLATIMQEAGQGNLQTRFSLLKERVAGGGTVRSSDVTRLLEDQAAALERGPVWDNWQAGDAGPDRPIVLAPTQAELETAELLRESVKVLRESLDQQKKTNDRLHNIGPLIGSGD